MFRLPRDTMLSAERSHRTEELNDHINNSDDDEGSRKEEDMVESIKVEVINMNKGKCQDGNVASFLSSQDSLESGSEELLPYSEDQEKTDYCNSVTDTRHDGNEMDFFDEIHENDLAEERKRRMKSDHISKLKRRFAILWALNDKHRKLVDPLANMRRSVLNPPDMQHEDVLKLDAAPIKLERYFGANARMSFLKKVNEVRREEAIKGTIEEEKDYSKSPKASLLPKERSLDYPFQPRRPPREKTKEKKTDWASSLGDVSCLDGYDDRPGVNVDECSTICSFDYENVADYQTIRPSSPRTTYISACVQDNLNPRVGLILRKNVSNDLNLQHQGMGDAMGLTFAKSLQDMPFVESINISHNNLSDVSLCPIIQAMSSLPNLTCVDLSQNVINRDASTALAGFVAQNETLSTLRLNRADVDDFECEFFVAAFAANLSLTELDLSHNEIGKCERINNIRRCDNFSGIEAISNFLSARDCCLKHLDLSWNHIRPEAAGIFAKCLRLNTSLVHLDLAFNSIGNTAGEIIGSSLTFNKTIEHLNLANNNIRGSGCFTICVGIMENYSLRWVCLDNNPLADAGARVLMKLPLDVGHRVKISVKNCNFSPDGLSNIYDESDPLKTYALSLEQPFQRAVAIRLLHLAATSEKYVFKKIVYQNKGSTDKHQIDLVPSISTEKKNHLNDNKLSILQNLKNLEAAAYDVKKARALFNKYDADRNNSLDVEEMMNLLRDIGVTVQRPAVERAIKVFDIDGAGTIEIDEFCFYLQAQAQDARDRISDLTETKILARSQHPSVKYVPPAKGTLHLTMSLDYAGSSKECAMTSFAIDDCLSMVQDGYHSIRNKLLGYSIENVKLRKVEAVRLFVAMKEECADSITVLGRILPRMIGSEEATEVLMLCLSSPLELSRLRVMMGYSLNPILGMFDGYYELNMAFEFDRTCLVMLLEQGARDKSLRSNSSLFELGQTGDLSQHGDWSCFRNSMKDGKTFHVNTAALTPLPKSGTFIFDFCGANKPPQKSKCISNRRCLNVLKNLCFIEDESKKHTAQEFLESMKNASIESAKGSGKFSNGLSLKRSFRIQYFMLKFYDSLSDRPSQCRRARELEAHSTSDQENDTFRETEHQIVMKAGLDDSDSSDASSESEDDCAALSGNFSVANFQSGRSLGVVPTVPQGRQASFIKKVDQSTLVNAGERKMKSRVSSLKIMAKRRETTTKGRGSMMKKKGSGKKKVTKKHSGHSAAQRALRYLQDAFQRVWLTSAQLALIASYFAYGKLKKTTDFGTYRVELICLLFSRVIDVQNFNLVISVLSSQEIACVYCRIGLLHLFNPLKPEGWYCLRLSNREERLVAKMLSVLSIEEPGRNWIDESFRWEFDATDIPGWFLPLRWLEDKHFPHHGFLSLKYYCGEGDGLGGCVADVPLRKALLHLVYIDEDDIIDDQCNADENGHRIHKRLIRMDKNGNRANVLTTGQTLAVGKRAEIWHKLLAPATSTSVRIASGANVEKTINRVASTEYRKCVSDLKEPSADSSFVKPNKNNNRKGKKRMDMSLPSSTGRNASRFSMSKKSIK